MLSYCCVQSRTVSCLSTLEGDVGLAMYASTCEWTPPTQGVNFLRWALILGVSNHWTEIWNGTIEWKMEWNSECAQL